MNTNKQPDPYKIDRLAGIPVPVKAVFIKFWFAGAVFYFVGMGIAALNTPDQQNLTLVLGIVLGMVTELLINNIFRYLATDKNDYGPYMVFGKKRFASFFLNILYNIVLSFLIAYTYTAINLFAMEGGLVPKGEIWLTTEPLLYGFFYILYDFFVLGVIALIKKLKLFQSSLRRSHRSKQRSE